MTNHEDTMEAAKSGSANPLESITKQAQENSDFVLVEVLSDRLTGEQAEQHLEALNGTHKEE